MDDAGFLRTHSYRVSLQLDFLGHSSLGRDFPICSRKQFLSTRSGMPSRAQSRPATAMPRMERTSGNEWPGFSEMVQEKGKEGAKARKDPEHRHRCTDQEFRPGEKNLGSRHKKKAPQSGGLPTLRGLIPRSLSRGKQWTALRRPEIVNEKSRRATRGSFPRPRAKASRFHLAWPRVRQSGRAPSLPLPWRRSRVRPIVWGLPWIRRTPR